MLLIFEGPGCKNCPFLQAYRITFYPDTQYKCGLSERDFNFDEPAIELIPNKDKIPKDCPFGEYPNTLEIECYPGG